MSASRGDNQQTMQGVSLYDRGGAVLPVDSDSLGIQNIGGVLYQVDPLGNLTPLIGGGTGGISALSGDVVATGPGAVTSTIQAGVVTYAKIQNVSSGVFLGRSSVGSGVVQEISAATAKTMLALAAIATSGSATDLTGGTVAAALMPAFAGGDVTSSAGSVVLTIGAGTVTLAKMANLADQRLIGNVSGGAAAPSALTKANVWTFLGATGIAAGSYTSANLTVTADGVITAISNGSGGSGAPSGATYITQTPDPGLSAEQALSTLATGLLKNTTTTGVLTIASAGTDYQAAGNYITALTGDGTASGPGSAAFTLATVNANVGTFTNATITVNAKGLITAASTGGGGGGGITALTGDVTASGTGSVAATLATVNANVGSFTYGSFTVNAKGLITAASNGVTPESPLTFSTGLTRSVNTITANLSVGVSGGQTAYGGSATTQSLTLRPNAADATTGQVIVSGIGLQVPVGSVSAASIHAGTVGTGFYQVTTAYWDFISGGATVLRMGPDTIQSQSNNDASGFFLGTAGQAGMLKDGAGGTNGVRFISTNVARARFSSTGLFQVYNTPFVSFTSASTVRAQANGEVMAFAAVPPSQIAAAGTTLNAYRWDAVTATFTTATPITTATGVNFIDIEAPTYTNASAMAVTNAATFTVKGAPVAAGSLTITNAYSAWFQGGAVRIDGTTLTNTLSGFGGGGALAIYNNVADASHIFLGPGALIEAKGDIFPSASVTYDLGSSTKIWAETYSANLFTGSITGNVSGSSQLYLQDSNSANTWMAFTSTTVQVAGTEFIPAIGLMGLGNASNYWYGCYLGTVNVGTAVVAGGTGGFAIKGIGGSAVVTVDDNAIGFFSVTTPVGQQTGGSLVATLTWDATSATMVNTLWGMARTYGLLT